MSRNSSDERIFARSHTCNVVARDAKGEGARRGVQTSVRLALLCGKKVKLHHARRRAVPESGRGDAHLTSEHFDPEGLTGHTRNGAAPSSLRFLPPEGSAAGVSKSSSGGNANTEPVDMISALS